MKHLHTGQFKQVYKEVKTPLPHVNFLILGFLVWLEQLYLDYTIKANVDSAIDDYHKQMDRLKNDKNLWGRYTYAARSGFPHLGRAILQHLSLAESDETHESQRNKDAVHVGLGLRLVKWDYPFTLIRNKDSAWDLSSSMCRHLLAFQNVSVSSQS